MTDTRTPHVDRAWSDAFIIELRMLDVSGAHIGSALADVEAHCADSGEGAAEAFGDPVTYARTLGLPRGSSRFSTVEVLALGAGLVGLFLTVYAAGAWASHEPVQVTLGLAACVVGLTAALALLLRNPEPVVRAVVARPWLVILANTAVLGGVLALLLSLDTTLFDLPAWAVGSVGLALVAWHTVDALRTRAAGTLDDPVVGPEGPDGVGSLDTGRSLAVLQALGPWVMAIATVVLGTLSLLPRLF